MSRVLTAMSGGVDSAVTAALLKEQGHEVAGAVMRLHGCADTEVRDAEASARTLGIPFYEFAWQEEFRQLVQLPFAQVYRDGGTPNPCVICNRTVKFGLFLDRALELGFEKIATGHYAKICRGADGRVLVRKAADASKDQTYMLYSLTQEQLARVILPMGDMTKQQAREKAQALGIPVAAKHDSQDICFVPDGDYLAWMAEEGFLPQKGRFIGPDGRDFGEHRGLEAYTIGQRRGLDIAFGSRIYVTGKQGTDVLVGPESSLYSTRVRLKDVNWIAFGRPDGPVRATAKLRYTAKEAACTAVCTEDGAELIFDEPQRAVTPGQAAVLYDGDLLLGGGTIL